MIVRIGLILFTIVRMFWFSNGYFVFFVLTKIIFASLKRSGILTED